MNKKYFFSHRVPAMLLTLTLCLGMIPTASAAQQNSYHDPVEHWQQASNRTNELDVNAIVTHETFYCATCRENTDFTVWRVPEYTRSGETALNRNVKYSNGMCIDEVTVGSLDAGVPGENAYYTGYHWTKSVCSRCGDWNSNETNGAPYAWNKNIVGGAFHFSRLSSAALPEKPPCPQWPDSHPGQCSVDFLRDASLYAYSKEELPDCMGYFLDSMHRKFPGRKSQHYRG